jgi:hypothetical protein
VSGFCLRLLGAVCFGAEYRKANLAKAVIYCWGKNRGFNKK